MAVQGNLVLDEVKARLTAISVSNGYGCDMGFVDRQFAWPEDIGQNFPAALVLPGGVQTRNHDRIKNRVSIDRLIHLFLYVHAPHEVSTVIEKLQADVLKALFSSPVCLNNLANGVQWLGSDTSAAAFACVGFQVGYAPPIGVCRMDINVWHNVELLHGGV